MFRYLLTFLLQKGPPALYTMQTEDHVEIGADCLMGPHPLLKMKKIGLFQYLHIRENANIKRLQKHFKKMEKGGLQPSSPQLKVCMVIGIKFHFVSEVFCTRGEEGCGSGSSVKHTALPSEVPQSAFVPAQQEKGSVYVSYWANESIIRCLIQQSCNLTVTKLKGNIFGNSFNLSVSSERTNV